MEAELSPQRDHWVPMSSRRPLTAQRLATPAPSCLGDAARPLLQGEAGKQLPAPQPTPRCQSVAKARFGNSLSQSFNYLGSAC